MSVQILVFWKVVLFTITAVPVTITTNILLEFVVNAGLSPNFRSWFGVFVIIVLTALIIRLFKDNVSLKKIRDPHFYWYALFAYFSVFKLIMGLEIDGILADFSTGYLEYGEPYLKSPYGTITCYLDGTILYGMYLLMIYKILHNQNYRPVALYWSGHLLNSMMVLLPAVFVGKEGISPATFLNFPLLIIPMIIGLKHLSIKPTKAQVQYKSLCSRPHDVCFIGLTWLVVHITIIRAMAVVSTNNVMVSQIYGETVEPLLRLDDPCPFTAIQMLINLFYMVPVYILTIKGLLKTECPWLIDLTLVHAGQASQAQLTHIINSFHPGNPLKYRPTSAVAGQFVFWSVNLMILLIPHLILMRSFKFARITSAPKLKKRLHVL